MTKVSAHDVAKYILKQAGGMTAMKLQKLLYYCQAWSLVWDEAPLFKEEIEAWANGPIISEIYQAHKGKFNITSWKTGSIEKLNKTQKETIDKVLDFYNKKTGQWLSELTHRESPWKDARKGLLPGERGSAKISHASMAEYYSGL